MLDLRPIDIMSLILGIYMYILLLYTKHIAKPTIHLLEKIMARHKQVLIHQFNLILNTYGHYN